MIEGATQANILKLALLSVIAGILTVCQKALVP